MEIELNFQKNSATIERELLWLSKLVENRLNLFFESTESQTVEQSQILPPSLDQDDSLFANFIKQNDVDIIERLIIVTAIASHFKPQLFDSFLIKNKVLNKNFTDFGGKIDHSVGHFVPTVRTTVFILFGNSVAGQLRVQKCFVEEHFFRLNTIISLDTSVNFRSVFDATLVLGDEFVHKITSEEAYKPNYSQKFPATEISANLDWNDLVVDDYVRDEIGTINTWLKYKDEIGQNIALSKSINKGFKSLFYGPPGTGKTLTAAILGKANGIQVYRIDLSQMVSKYIGETEKNLKALFDIAENKNWILFFDEAESLFSKRTSVNDSKDKYANQQTAYLLQRIENYDGLVILATNLKPNMDMAFSRRIQSTIHFQIPNEIQRRTLWKNALKDIAEISTSQINEIAKNYEIAGGSIKNVVQYAWLMSKRNQTAISFLQLQIGIKREVHKEGKTFKMD